MSARLLVFNLLALLAAAPVFGQQAAAPTSTPVSVQEFLSREMPAKLSEEDALFPSLRGIILAADSTGADLPVPAGFTGIDTSRVPYLAGALDEVAPYVLNKPASLPSLQRIATTVQMLLVQRGRRFVVAYLPPQDLTDSVVRIIVQPSRVSAVEISGAQYFAEADYRSEIPVGEGDLMDAAGIQHTVDRLNRNPFHTVSILAQPGAEPATTKLVMTVQDRMPVRASATFDDTGTEVTGRSRTGLGLTWGNAFGRGDQVSYQYKFDPEHRRTESHVASYVTELTTRGTLTANGAWSGVHPDLPAPLAQNGTSWQTAAAYTLHRGRRAGWTTDWTGGADFKSSDNNLDFGGIPIINNLTHVAQMHGDLAIGHAGPGSNTQLFASLVLSPGGLTERNSDESFGLTRQGATARYGYGKFGVEHSRTIARTWMWTAAVDVQLTSSVLLGSEQLTGGGAAAVRGYSDTAAFADQGITLRMELHAPALASAGAGGHRLDPFVFYDAGRLVENGPLGDSFGLQGAGGGIGYQLGGKLSLRASYGRQLQSLRGAPKDGRAHVAMQVAF